MKKKWFLVILFLGLTIAVGIFLTKESTEPVKENHGIELPGISEKVVYNKNEEDLETWPKELRNNIGEFNILVAGEFFILFVDQKNNNEIDEIKESIYKQIEHFERVAVKEFFELVRDKI